VSIAAFVAGVDRILSRAHELYPAGGGGAPLPVSGGGSVPGAPTGASGMAEGVVRAAGSYVQARTGAAGLDQQLQQAAEQGAVIGAQGRVGSGVIRDQARVIGAQAGVLGRSPAGAQLIMAAMDQHLSAMQGQVQTTKTEYQAVSATLRETAAGYHTLSNGTQRDGLQDQTGEDTIVGDRRRPGTPTIQQAGFGQGGPPQAPAPSPPPPAPTPPPLQNVPQPLQDFTQYTIRGIPVPPPPPPNVTADQLRMQLLQQHVDFNEFMNWYNNNLPKPPNFAAFLAALGGTGGATVGVLATIPGLPEDWPLTALAGSGLLGSLYALYQTMTPGPLPDMSKAPGGPGYTIPGF
jgi:hypothetical protein